MKPLVTIVFLILLFAPHPGLSQLATAERCNEPIDVGGELLEVVDNIATLTGDVRVLQCDAVLSTLKLIGIQDDQGSYESLRAEGRVRYSNGAEAIRSETALYDLVNRTITFTDNVVVTQGKQVMTGGALVYWIDSGRIRFTAPSGNRIRGLFHSNDANAKL